MKKCHVCNETKSPDDFNYRNKNKGTRQSHCKVCTRKQIRDHYNKNRFYYLAKSKIRNEQNRMLLQSFIREYLGKHPCIDCGESDPVVLEFDHVTGKKHKSYNVSTIVGSNHNIEKVKKEVAKCVVRCANCHRRKTARDFNWHKLTNMHP